MNRRLPIPALLSALLLSLASSLAVAGFPSVTGNVFHDADSNGAVNDGEGMQGVTLRLFADDGDGIFDETLDALVASEVTNADGTYSFDSLSPDATYFVQQVETLAGSLVLPGSVSGLISPGSYHLMIDEFADQQVVSGNPIFPVGQSTLTSPSVIGGQRDLHLEYLSGPAESNLRANPYGLKDVLEFDQSAGVISRATVTWDGIDADMSVVPAVGGLGGTDLTQDGSNAFAFTLGVDAAGADETLELRIYSGEDISTATMDLTVTDGTATAFQVVPFTSFVGDASFEHVDAIQLVLGGNSPSVDAQVGPIGLIGPAIHNIAVAIPEPSGILLAAFAVAWIAGRRRRR